MKLPSQKCPNTERKDCKLCGPWSRWIDLADPTRLPTPGEWYSCCVEMQKRHDAIRQRHFDSLELVPV